MLLLLAGCTAPSPDSTDPTEVDSVVDSPADSAIDSEELPGHSFDFPDFSAARPGEKNHLLPLKTAVDSRSRRAFVVSEALGTVAVVDLDSQEVLKVLQLGTGGKADVVADGLGGAVLYERGSDVITWLKDDFQSISLSTGYDRMGGVLVESGVVWAVGSRGDEQHFSRWDRSGQRLAEVVLNTEVIPDTLVPWATGRALLVGTNDAVFVDADGSTTLALTLPGATWDAERFAGKLALVSSTQALIAGVEGTQRVGGGVDYTSLVVGPDRFWVLDRDGDDRNIGVVRSYDDQLQEVAPPFSTGKNNGYGGYDRNTGHLWMSSEGESQLQRYDPLTGTRLQGVPLGVHTDRAVSRPDRPEQVFVTGRLSNLLLRYDAATGEHLDAASVPFWPVAPAIWTSSYGQELWVASQVDGRLCAYSMDLELRECFSLGLPNDETLLIADTELRPGGGLLFAAGGADQLVELSEAGEIRQRWELADEQPTPEEEQGRMDILVSPAGQVFVVRCSDGRIGRVDGDQVQTARPVQGLVDDLPMGLCASWDQDRLYVFGHAVNPATLEREPAEDQPWRYRLDSGAAWYPEDRSIRVDGREIATIAQGFWDPVFFGLPGAPGWVGWTEIEEAGLHLRPLAAPEGQ